MSVSGIWLRRSKRRTAELDLRSRSDQATFRRHRQAESSKLMQQVVGWRLGKQLACAHFHRPRTVKIAVRCSSSTPPSAASLPYDKAEKKAMIAQLVAAKEATGKTYTQIAQEVGLTNAYTAQLFLNQAMLHPGREDAIKKAVPGLTDEHIAFMKRCPMRTFDPDLMKEPHIYRMHEAMSMYGEAVKAIMNEEFGDGIMSAIDMFATVNKVEGKTGEKRVCITLNGKFLPHIEQATENNTAPQ
ncbi:hypothetical protein WJX73_009719 [Symbiochloris irregularis]|uniref:Cyanate lyase C-terminal domain-containing protein n=1 Tax=Symbiochloris irregularis TaxID=706552 RepID=A0AAW1PNL5_9CHLO